MAQDSTRRLLRMFGIAVTDLEEAVESNQADAARQAAAQARERMAEIAELVKRLSDAAARL